MTQINVNYMLSSAASTGAEKSDADVDAGPPGLFGELMGKKLGVKLDGQPSGSERDGKSAGKNLGITDGEAKEGEAADNGLDGLAPAPAEGDPATTSMATAVPAPIVSVVWAGQDPQTILPESVADAEGGNVPVAGADESDETAAGDAVDPRMSSSKPANHWSWFQKGIPKPSLAASPAAPVSGTGLPGGSMATAATNGDGTPSADGLLSLGESAAPAVGQDPESGSRNPAAGGAAGVAAPAVAQEPASGLRPSVFAKASFFAQGVTQDKTPASGIRHPASGDLGQASAPQIVSQGNTAAPVSQDPASGIRHPASGGAAILAAATVAAAGATSPRASGPFAADGGIPLAVASTGNTMKTNGVARVETRPTTMTDRPTFSAIASSGGRENAIAPGEPLQAVDLAEPNPQADALRATVESRPGGRTASSVFPSLPAGNVAAPAAAQDPASGIRNAASGEPAAMPPAGQANDATSVPGEAEGWVRNAENSGANGPQKTVGEGKGRLTAQKGRMFKGALTQAETSAKTAPNGPAAGRAAGGEGPAIPVPTLEAGAQHTAMESLGTAGVQPRHSSTAPESAPSFQATPAAAPVASASTASSATPPESARGLVMDRVMKLQELMDRFDRHAAAAAAEKDGSMTIKLIPDNLGKVSLNCREANGVLQMQVVVENQGVRTLLAQHETAIRHLLEQAGIQLSSFDVRTQQEGPGSRQLNGRGQGQNGLGGRQVEAVTAGELEEAAPEAPAYWSREQTQMWIA